MSQKVAAPALARGVRPGCLAGSVELTQNWEGERRSQMGASKGRYLKPRPGGLVTTFSFEPQQPKNFLLWQEPQSTRQQGIITPACR